MINVKYYLNGQVLYGFSEEIATVDNLYDFIGTKENTIVPLKCKEFISKGATYNLFTNTLEIVLVNKVKFTHDIFVTNCPEHLIEQLEYIGYVKSELCGVGKNLITNGTQGKYYFTDNDLITMRNCINILGNDQIFPYIIEYTKNSKNY